MKRTKLDPITRVMGYLRPLSHYNIGKKVEFKDRVWFDNLKEFNSNFISKY